MEGIKPSGTCTFDFHRPPAPILHLFKVLVEHEPIVPALLAADVKQLALYQDRLQGVLLDYPIELLVAWKSGREFQMRVFSLGYNANINFIALLYPELFDELSPADKSSLFSSFVANYVAPVAELISLGQLQLAARLLVCAPTLFDLNTQLEAAEQLTDVKWDRPHRALIEQRVRALQSRCGPS